MNKIVLYLALFLLSAPSLQAQVEDIAWIVALTEEIVAETDLCERCQWVSPTVSKVESGRNNTYYFLRYSCSISESYARMYDEAGLLLGDCVTIGGNSTCMGQDGFTVYTFADNIEALWNCNSGFDCQFALDNDIEPTVPILVDDSKCVEGIKILRASEEFVAYEWEGNGDAGVASSLEIDQAGDYFLTVTDVNGCIIEGAINIPDIEKLEVKIKGANIICASTTTLLKTTSFQSYQWSTGATGSLIEVSLNGNYMVTVTNDLDCEGSTSFQLTYFEPTDISISVNTESIQEGESVFAMLDNSTAGNSIISQEWSGLGVIDCANCPSVTYQPFSNSTLSVSTIDENTCTSEATIAIEVKELPIAAYAPNAFQPNANTNNNFFTIFGGVNLQVIDYLRIFDRWGNLIYSANNILPNQRSGAWDGRVNGMDASEGIYLYMAKVMFTNGTTELVEGDILLIR